MHLNSASSLKPAVPRTGLQNQVISLTALRSLTVQQQTHLLGVIAFTTEPLPAGIVPALRVPTQVFTDNRATAENLPACEVWFHQCERNGNTQDIQLMDGMQSMSVDLVDAEGGEMRYRHDGEYLFGTIVLPEFSPAEDNAMPPLQHVSALAYRHIFHLLDALDYQHVYRFWNYIADINGTSHGQERYRQFNIGRQDAFLASQRALTGQLPAACALGVDEGPLTIAFLAGRKPAHAVENPRQVSAYEYPEDYGPRSPSFSRATLLPGDRAQGDAAQDTLFVSGTASIVGHKTLHAGDVLAQARETLTNLQALVEEAVLQNKRPGHAFDTQNAIYRVYLRYPQDLPLVKKEILRVFGEQANTVFLQADVCRDDLLLEIEATLFSSPSSSFSQQTSREPGA